MADKDDLNVSKGTNREGDYETGQSSPGSTTQTANSWVPVPEGNNQNVTNVVGRTTSFEYLPGNY